MTKSVLRVQRSAERAAFDHGWLQTRHSFSFADYQDTQNMNWGALRVFNDDIVAPDQGFGTHAHRDMEILTYVLEGELTHRDSLGNIGTVRPGGVQYLSAGTGITHSEYNASKTDRCHFVQMWVLPHAAGLSPRYGQIDFPVAARHNRWLTVAAGREGIAAPIQIWQDASCAVASLQGGPVEVALASARFGFLFVALGEVTVRPAEGEIIILGAGDALRMTGPQSLSLTGTAELIRWDVPAAH